jgi:hypothetical protein
MSGVRKKCGKGKGSLVRQQEILEAGDGLELGRVAVIEGRWVAVIEA